MLGALLKEILVTPIMPPPPPPPLAPVGGKADKDAPKRLLEWLLNIKEGDGGEPSEEEEASMDGGGEEREGGMWLLLLEVACWRR